MEESKDVENESLASEVQNIDKNKTPAEEDEEEETKDIVIRKPRRSSLQYPAKRRRSSMSGKDASKVKGPRRMSSIEKKIRRFSMRRNSVNKGRRLSMRRMSAILRKIKRGPKKRRKKRKKKKKVSRPVRIEIAKAWNWLRPYHNDHLSRKTWGAGRVQRDTKYKTQHRIRSMGIAYPKVQRILKAHQDLRDAMYDENSKRLRIAVRNAKLVGVRI